MSLFFSRVFRPVPGGAAASRGVSGSVVEILVLFLMCFVIVFKCVVGVIVVGHIVVVVVPVQTPIF